MPITKNKKVIVRIFGGIGNQLFCYAAARRLAFINNAELVIDNVSGFRYDYVYRRRYMLDHFNIPFRKATAGERLEPFSRIRRYLLKRIERLKPFEKRKYIQQEGLDYDPRLLKFKVNGTVYIEGYWQSEDYFKDIEWVIREELKIKAPDDEKNIAMAELIKKELSVAIHFRFFDRPDIKSNHNAPAEYYAKAVNFIEKHLSNAHYFIFSDRPIEARRLIKLQDERVTLVSHNLGDNYGFADLWLMTLCKHFIIANSTFSWWGAWLSESKNKIVIAPIINHPSWSFKGLLPDNWIKL